jgi:hypothetical protein
MVYLPLHTFQTGQGLTPAGFEANPVHQPLLGGGCNREGWDGDDLAGLLPSLFLSATIFEFRVGICVCRGLPGRWDHREGGI